MVKRIALTGGIACGKSLVGRFLNTFGIETLDADDVVHTLIPVEERRRLAKIVFQDAAARRALEARIHPQVRARLDEWSAAALPALPRVCIIPLLFETGWETSYDIIACVASAREAQLSRMMTTRGYSREEAEARLAAQLPVAEKAARSHYVIYNNGSTEDLKTETERFVSWLKNSMCSPIQ